MKLCIWCFVIGSLFAQSANQTALVILGGKGWSCVRNKRLVVRGDRLTAHEEIAGGEGTGELLLDCGDSGWRKHSCGKQKSCVVRACEGNDSLLQYVPAPMLHLMTDLLLKDEPAETVTLGVRGGGNPADAVVLQDVQGVHWAPALTRVLEGRYCFRLSPLPQGTGGPSRTFILDWDRSLESEGLAQLPNLAPGAYAMEKGTPGADGRCSPDPDTTAAWVVVVPASDFARASAEWKDQSAHFDRLRSGASLPVIVTARHALLAWLADSVVKK